MKTVSGEVYDVNPWDATSSGKPRWRVRLMTTSDHFYTVNAFMASLCQRALNIQQPVTITYSEYPARSHRDPPWLNIQTVTLEGSGVNGVAV